MKKLLAIIWLNWMGACVLIGLFAAGTAPKWIIGALFGLALYILGVPTYFAFKEVTKTDDWHHYD